MELVTQLRQDIHLKLSDRPHKDLNKTPPNFKDLKVTSLMLI